MTGDLIKWLREEASFAYHRAEEDMLTEAADRIEALEAENMMLREERDRLIKFVNIMCEEYGLEYDGVVKQ
jgi:hypothetical protein